MIVEFKQWLESKKYFLKENDIEFTRGNDVGSINGIEHSYYCDFFNEKFIGRIVVWLDDSIELEVLNMERGDQVFFKYYQSCDVEIEIYLDEFISILLNH